jgi:hypothetical protein
MTPEEIEAKRLQDEAAAKKANEKTHSDKAFRQVSDDMHKYKSGMAELQAKLDQQGLDREDAERKSRESKEEYKSLYEESQSEVKGLRSDIEEKNNSFIKAQKLSAVKDKLGGFKKEVYNKFIDTSRVIIDNDGQVDLSTVDNEVARLKKEYPELIKVKQSSRLPNEQPESGDVNPKPVQKMTVDERNDLRRQLIEAKMKTT